MSRVVDSTLSLIRDRRNNVLNGIINSIPSPFKRFSSEYIGIERGTYYLLTAGTKVGKTQMASFLFVFNPVLYAYFNTNASVKIFYFPLEETPERITCRFISYLLFILHKKEVDYITLMSAKNKALDAEILELIEGNSIQRILKFYSQCVEFVTGETTAAGIYRRMMSYAEANGNIYYSNYKVKDDFGNMVERRSFSHYVPNDPKRYVLFIVDHVSLLMPEKGTSRKDAIDRLSNYCVNLRDDFGFSPVIIQQQAFNETAENLKSGNTRPTLTGLSDSKYTARDSNIVLGLYSPYRGKEPNFLGYDITLLRDSFRSIEVLANRNGETGGIIGLLFKGSLCYFKEMPAQNSEELDDMYNELKLKQL